MTFRQKIIKETVLEIKIEELAAWGYLDLKLVDILNKDYDLDEAIEDIKSFRNSKWYTGTEDKFKEIE